jgi:hypothetical protein
MAIHYRDRGFKDVALVSSVTSNASTGIYPVSDQSINILGFTAHANTRLWTTSIVNTGANTPICAVPIGGTNLPCTIKLPVGTGVYVQHAGTDHTSIYYFLSN